MNKEYVERDAVIAFLENMAASRYLIQCFEDKERFPAADVAPVWHGEWVEIVSCEDIIYATCNQCHSRGKVRTNRNQWGLWYMDSPFCPKCGAKMNGGK